MSWVNDILADGYVLLGVPVEHSNEERSMHTACLLTWGSPSSAPPLPTDHSASPPLNSPSLSFTLSLILEAGSQGLMHAQVDC